MGRDWRIYLAAGVVLAVVGMTFALLASRPHYQPRSLPRYAPSVTPAASALPVSPKVAAAIPKSLPVRLIIPSISVNALVGPEGSDSTGALEVPPLSGPQASDAGWWEGGHTPGQDGPAVIVGHIDSAAPLPRRTARRRSHLHTPTWLPMEGTNPVGPRANGQFDSRHELVAATSCDSRLRYGNIRSRHN